jgi:lipid-binding SYLF domain-containing protein
MRETPVQQYLDKVVPAGIISGAQGLAILTIAKAGFLVTARAGTGIVIARLRDGCMLCLRPPEGVSCD